MRARGVQAPFSNAIKNIIKFMNGKRATKKKKAVFRTRASFLTPARLKKRASLGLDANSVIWHVVCFARQKPKNVKNTSGFPSKMRALGAPKSAHFYGKAAVTASDCDSKTRAGCSQARFRALGSERARATTTPQIRVEHQKRLE